ncbi:hypothetical protein LINPERHAP1_LOCUS16216 [Linum perenne]
MEVEEGVVLVVVPRVLGEGPELMPHHLEPEENKEACMLLPEV